MSKTFGRSNQLDCHHCENVIESRELARTVKWGFWDRDSQNYDGGARADAYCESCWRREFERPAAAHYEVEDGDRLWRLLEAADGRLVADLKPMTVGRRDWIAVIDGDLHGIHATVDAREVDGERIIEFGTEPSDLDREWFDEFFANAGDSGMPMLALLEPRDETPFDTYAPVADGQQRLADAVETDGGDAGA